MLLVSQILHSLKFHAYDETANSPKALAKAQSQKEDKDTINENPLQTYSIHPDDPNSLRYEKDKALLTTSLDMIQNVATDLKNPVQNLLKSNLVVVRKLLTNADLLNILYFENHSKSLSWSDSQSLKISSFIENYKKANRNQKFQFTQITNPLQNRICNHLEYNFLLSNKKAMYHNLKHLYQVMKVDPFEYIPLTLHIQKGVEDPEFEKSNLEKIPTEDLEYQYLII